MSGFGWVGRALKKSTPVEVNLPPVPETAPVAVFVHGLASGPSAWDQMVEFCRQDSALSEFALDRFSYPTRLFRIPLLPIMPRIQDIAKGLQTFLETHHPARTKLVLVCHSLGGLVARQMILDLVKAGRDISRFSLVLFACPNNGSALAEVAKAFSIGQLHLGQIGRNTDALGFLNEEWRRLEIEESADLLFVAGGADGIVSPEDARSFCKSSRTETIIEATHSSIIRPETAANTAFLIVRREMLRVTTPSNCSPPSAAMRPPNPLFEVYYDVDEPYYIQRGVDSVLGDENSVCNVWLHGPSGLGKTAALRRRVIRSGAKVHQVVLAAFGNEGPEELLKRICDSMLNAVDEGTSTPASTQDLTQTFRDACRKLAKDGYLALQIEEIPLGSSSELFRFLELVYLCCQSLELEQRRHTTLSFSSITDPRSKSSTLLTKIEEKLLFIEIGNWNDKDADSLISLISDALELPLTAADALGLRRLARGSPRFIKRFFRIWRVKRADAPSFATLIDLTQQEQVAG